MSAGVEILIYSLVFVCAALGLQVIYGAQRYATSKVKLINERVRRMEEEDSQKLVIESLYKSRGLTSDGRLRRGIKWLNTCILHSGLPFGLNGFYYSWVISAGFSALMGYTFKGTLMWSGIGLVIGIGLPIFILTRLANRRRNKAVMQLPEALDVIIRSLRAGHPVPVAMTLVAQEMPDPIGSEFGMAGDEISFGATTSRAVQRLAERVGHPDFELFAAMIRLQERTGGNLAELLASNAQTLRDRQRMRLKIKSASSEGRMSAKILNIVPIGLFLTLKTMSPDFYGDVEDNPIINQALWGVCIWMLIGNLIMRRMINFRI